MKRLEAVESIHQMTGLSSNGRTVNLEFKKDVSRARTYDQQQIIVHSIVLGWTQFNKYPKMRACMPFVCVY